MKRSETINDKSKFKELGPIKDNNGIVKLEKICKIIKELWDNKETIPKMFDCCKPVGSIRPRLYDLKKLHKTNIH